MSGKAQLELITRGEAQTEAIGRAIEKMAAAGDLIGLVGQLGAGKTRMIKGIAAGLGLNSRQITSPTFVLIKEYEGRLRLFHVDAYRLSGGKELESMGFEEIAGQGGLTVVEWADHVADCLPADRLTVTLEIIGPQKRQIRISSEGTVSESLLERIRGYWSGGTE